MLFIDNKDTKWYYNIIVAARARATTFGYTEKHHIIPKSLGGTNDCGNLVTLTTKEHYICHRLLVKMTDGLSKKKMRYALYCLTHVKNANQQFRHSPYFRKLEEFKTQWRESIKGRPAHNKGKTMSNEQKEKLRNANLGKPSYIRSDETLKKMSAARKGKPIPKLQGRVSNRKGIPMSVEQKEKIRQSCLGKNTGKRSPEVCKRIREGILRAKESRK